MAPRARRFFLLLVLGGGLVALVGWRAGWWRSESPLAPANRTTWQSAFQAVLGALGQADYDALRELLTPVGKQTLDADLALFGRMVADPMEGPRVMAKVRQRWPEVPDALVEGARAGHVGAAWKLFLGAGVPRGQRPEGAGVRIDPRRAEHVIALYRYPGGPELPIELVRVRGEWAVDKVALGSP